MSTPYTHELFSLLPEDEAITVDASNIAALSLPEELLRVQPPADAIMTQFRSGEAERQIHCNVKLTQDEQEKLASLRALAKDQGKSLLPSLTAAATRYLGRNKGDARKALRDIIATQEWRLNYFKDGPITDKSVMQDLATGAVYFTGRDQWLRPTLVIRACRIPLDWANDTGPGDNRLLRVVVFCLEYMLRYMLLPGHVESGIVVLDLQEITWGQVPVSVVKHMFNILSKHYCTRISTFYVMHTPQALKGPSQFVLRLLTDRQRQKLRIINGSEEMAAHFALHHLECDLGGTRLPITTFFPFALEAGPFDAGLATGANNNSIADIHMAFSRTSMLGRFWNPNLQPNENLRLDFNRGASPELLQRCGLLPPPEDNIYLPTLVLNSAPQPLNAEKLAARAAERSITSSEDTWEGEEEPISVVKTPPVENVHIKSDESRPATSRFCWLPMCY